MSEWCTYRHSYHGVVWFPFCLLVHTKLGRRLCRLDIADYQDTGLWVGKRDMEKKMRLLNILQATVIGLHGMTTKNKNTATSTTEYALLLKVTYYISPTNNKVTFECKCDL